MSQSTLYPTDGAVARAVSIPSVSWGAVFAGVLLALVAYVFLAALGAAIGAGSIDAMQAGNPLSGFGSGAGIWAGVSTLIALAVGAFFAGRSASSRGALHGVLSWALTTLLMLYAISSLIGGVIGTATRVAGSGMSLAGQSVAAVAPSIASGVKDQMQKSGISFDFSDAQRQLEALLRQTGKSELNPERLKEQAGEAAQEGQAAATDAANRPQAATEDLASFFERLRQKAQPALEAADREALINIIVARTDKSRAEAEQLAANYEQTYNQAVAKYEELKVQAEQKAREAGEAAAKGVSQAAWAAVVLMLLGIVVSAVAGFFGRKTARAEVERVQL